MVYNKKALIRVDLNVPIANGKIEDDTRIKKIIPTLKILLEKKASIILITHLGRPNGEWVDDATCVDPCDVHVEPSLDVGTVRGMATLEKA